MYLVRRDASPRYQLLLKNQVSVGGLVDGLHADWKLDCQTNWCFYEVEIPSELVRGLWFPDDADCQLIGGLLERTLKGIQQAETQPEQPAQPGGGSLATVTPRGTVAAALARVRARKEREEVLICLSSSDTDGSGATHQGDAVDQLVRERAAERCRAWVRALAPGTQPEMWVGSRPSRPRRRVRQRVEPGPAQPAASDSSAAHPAQIIRGPIEAARFDPD